MADRGKEMFQGYPTFMASETLYTAIMKDTYI